MLHDLNHAARCASHVIAMKAGKVIAAGTPDDVITAATVSEVFGLETAVIPDPITGKPISCRTTREQFDEATIVEVAIRRATNF